MTGFGKVVIILDYILEFFDFINDTRLTFGHLKPISRPYKSIVLSKFRGLTLAGASKNLKAGTVVFKAGDNSDGMYIVRKGELTVFLEKEGKQVTLAQLTDGAVVGEMSFFEQKPRSASVKATKDCEVTHISNDDFSKLLKQIPKWFVTLMGALSGRLRQTNERLQKLEGIRASKEGPYESTLKALHLLVLLWHKDGAKAEKGSTLSRDAALKSMSMFLPELSEHCKKLIDTLIAQKLFGTQKDNYGSIVLSIASRANIDRLIDFVTTWSKANGALKCLSEDSLKMLEMGAKMAHASPYEHITVSLQTFEEEGKNQGLDTANWRKSINEFAHAGEIVSLTKTSEGPALKILKKDINTVLAQHRMLSALALAGLS
jgi:CRP-like cAMP-binding protein